MQPYHSHAYLIVSLPVVASNMAKVDETIRGLEEAVGKIQGELEGLQPNMHATVRYEGVLQKLDEASDALEELKVAARDASVAFEAVKRQRLHLFQVGTTHSRSSPHGFN